MFLFLPFLPEAIPAHERFPYFEGTDDEAPPAKTTSGFFLYPTDVERHCVQRT